MFRHFNSVFLFFIDLVRYFLLSNPAVCFSLNILLVIAFLVYLSSLMWKWIISISQLSIICVQKHTGFLLLTENRARDKQHCAWKNKSGSSKTFKRAGNCRASATVELSSMNPVCCGVITRWERWSKQRSGDREETGSLTKRKERALLCRIPSTSPPTPCYSFQLNCSNITPSSFEHLHVHTHTHGCGIVHQSVRKGGTSLVGRRQRRRRMKSSRWRRGEGITTPVGNVGLAVGWGRKVWGEWLMTWDGGEKSTRAKTGTIIIR